MSTVKTNNVQVGQSLTASQNFTWYQPASPDGTVRLGNGNSGSVTDLVTLTSAGNVGIGTSSPGQKLEVSGASVKARLTTTTANTGAAIQFYEIGNAAWEIGNSNGANGSFYLKDLYNNAERLVISNSGNLGLGVTPSGWYASGVGWKALQVGAFGLLSNTATNDSRLMSNAYLNTGGSYIYLNSSQNATNYIQSAGVHSWYTAPSGTAGNAISFTQAMTLDASGNLNIGCASTPTSTNSGFQYQPNGALVLGRTVTSTVAAVYFINGNGTVGQINTGGTTTTYVTSSDLRLKTNIAPAGSAIQSILDFPVDQFDWVADGTHQDFGAVAQKAINVIPEMVSVPADPDEMWGIDWSKAVPRLIKTIQEMHEEIQTLKQKVNA